jgi:uncharacterized phiE125 gp8 family phage protein
MGLALLEILGDSPVTLADARAQTLAVEGLDDALLTGLIAAATQAVGDRLNRPLQVSRFRQTWHAFPHNPSNRLASPLYLWQAPLVQELPGGESPQEVPPIVTYLDGDGAVQTLADSMYVVSDGYPTPSIARAIHSTWPTTGDLPDAVRAEYHAGWTPATCPAPLKQAVLLVVGDLYEHRNAQTEKPLTENRAVEALIAPYRMNY